MKHYASIVIYNNDKTKGHIHRENFELSNIPVSYFDYEKHIGKLFIFPEGEMNTGTLIYAWQWCECENQIEEDRLIENGDMVNLGTLGGSKHNVFINKKQKLQP